MYSVNENMKAIERMTKNEQYIKEIYRNDFDLIVSLSRVKTIEDYKYWMKHAERHLPTRGVMNKGNHASLDSFF